MTDIPNNVINDLHAEPFGGPRYVEGSELFDLRGFFLNLVRATTLHPASVTVDDRVQADIHRLSICVDAQDFKMFVQSDRRTFLALQTILKAVIRREKMLATIEVVNRQTGAHLE